MKLLLISQDVQTDWLVQSKQPVSVLEQVAQLLPVLKANPASHAQVGALSRKLPALLQEIQVDASVQDRQPGITEQLAQTPPFR